MKYSLQVKDPKVFYGFTVRPKVCDEMFHCFDTFVAKQTDKDANTKTVEFNFQRLSAKYIKLLFYIEYSQPEEGLVLSSVEFDLRMLHLGDPCSNDNEVCLNGGICVSDDTKDSPNSLMCDCEEGWMGEKCDVPDRCLQMDTKLKNHSPEYYCEMEVKTKGCINWNNTFMCKCEGELLNWDR